MWTGTIAAVVGVTQAATARRIERRRSASIRRTTGLAPVIMMASARYTAESGEVMTSSPGPTPRARSADRDGVRSGADSDRRWHAARGRELALERFELGAEHEPPALDHARIAASRTAVVIRDPA